MTPRWSYGDTVLYRYGRQGQARFVRVGRVIADDADGLALWIGPGTPQVETVLADGRDLRAVPITDQLRLPRTRRRSIWRGQGIVQYAPAAGDWSLWWFFQPDGRFEAWYGNLGTDYRPDPAWGPVSLPDDWDRPHRATA